MKQVLIDLDDKMAAELEAVAPSRSRRRSEFIRMAIRKAIWELQEQATAEAYRHQPDSDEPEYLDPEAWQPAPRSPTRKRKRK